MAKRHKKKNHASEVIPTESQPKRAWAIRSLQWSLIQATTIAVAVFWVFWPALHGDWIWDDNIYFAENPLMHDPGRLWKAWFEPGSFIEYYPIEQTIQWIQWLLWHNETFGYHLTNVLLHIANALLVWRLLSKLGLRLAWLGGFIFAIHPVQVESVAWIVEFKNTLSLLPFLLAMCFYIDYDEQKKSRDYYWAVGLFLVAMLCKPTMVMFPVIILLYAWWKRNRVREKDLKASAPFFAISLAVGLLTLHVGTRYLQLNHAHISEVAVGGFLSRLALAGASLAFYFSKCFLPVGLLPMYPKWTIDPPSPLQFLPWLILAGILYGLWMKRASWGRHVLLGLGFFFVIIAPFIGFKTISYMAFTWVMDHFLYIPIIGLIGLAVAGLQQIRERLPGSARFFLMIIMMAVMALMAWESHQYAGNYLNEETFWTDTLRYNPDAWAAHQNLGTVLFKKGQIAKAMEQFEQTINLAPDYVNAYYSLGIALLKFNHVSEARQQFEQALKVDPDYAELHNSLGNLLVREGESADALQQFKQAIALNPDYLEAHRNLGVALFKAKQIPAAIEQFQQVVRIDPYDAPARQNLGCALELAGQIREAATQYELAIRLNPNLAEAHNSLGSTLGRAGQISDAIKEYRIATRLNPNYIQARDNLAYALSQANRIPEAIEQYEQVLKIDPNDIKAQSELKRLQSSGAIFPQKSSTEK